MLTQGISNGPAGAAGGATTAPADDAFGRLATLILSTDAHLAELGVLNARLEETRAYLASPTCNPSLGRSYYRRVRERRSRVLAALRANRLAAREFLAS